MPFCPYDGRWVRLWYLSAGYRYTTRIGRMVDIEVQGRHRRTQVEHIIAHVDQLRLDIACEQLAAMAPEGPEPDLADQDQHHAGREDDLEEGFHLGHNGDVQAQTMAHGLHDGAHAAET